jgi:tRNA(Ile)-lysidine synthase
VKDDGRIYLRPLLTLSKGEIMAALSSVGVMWREDATNSTREYFRTRVRYEVLPRWQDAACNSVLGGAALSRELCEEDDVALEAWLVELKVVATETMIDLQPLLGKPRALWRRALRRWSPVGAMSRAGFEELLALCESGGAGRVSLHEGFAVVKEAVIHWERPSHSAEIWAAKTLREGEPVFLPDGATLVARRVFFDAELKRRVLTGKVDRACEAFLYGCDFPFTARQWLSGDRFKPLGAPGSAKLQDLFVNRKVPAEQRGTLPVVCASEGEILWVPGFSPADQAKVIDESKAGVQLTYHCGTSTVPDQS